MDWGAPPAQLRANVEVDGAALEVELLHAAEPREFGGHLLWSERLHRLQLMTRRRSRDGKEEPCYVWSARRGALLSCLSDLLATLTHIGLTHGSGLKDYDGTRNVHLATRTQSISSKQHGRIRCRSWLDIIHSELYAASRGSGDCSSSLLLDVHHLKRLL